MVSLRASLMIATDAVTATPKALSPTPAESAKSRRKPLIAGSVFSLPR